MLPKALRRESGGKNVMNKYMGITPYHDHFSMYFAA